MLKLTWQHLKDPDFMTSLTKLFTNSIGFEAASKLKLLGAEIKKQQNEERIQHETILKQYGKPNEKQKSSYDIPEENREKYASVMSELGKTDFTVRIGRINAATVAELAKLTAQDLMLLENILTPIELEPELPVGENVLPLNQAAPEASH